MFVIRTMEITLITLVNDKFTFQFFFILRSFLVKMQRKGKMSEGASWPTENFSMETSTFCSCLLKSSIWTNTLFGASFKWAYWVNRTQRQMFREQNNATDFGIKMLYWITSVMSHLRNTCFMLSFCSKSYFCSPYRPYDKRDTERFSRSTFVKWPFDQVQTYDKGAWIVCWVDLYYAWIYLLCKTFEESYLRYIH